MAACSPYRNPLRGAAEPPRRAARPSPVAMLAPIVFAVLVGLPLSAAGAGDTPPDSPAQSGDAAKSGKAQPDAAPDAQGATADESGEEGPLDEAREEVRSATEWVVRQVDSWFGDQPFEQGGRVAGRIALRMLWRQDQGFDWLTRFGLRVNLPNLRDRSGFLFVGRDNEREVVSDRPDAFTRREQLLQETRSDQSFFAGLGAQLARDIALRAGFRGGLKPYAQARYEKLWDIGARNRLDFKETLFWTLSDGFGSTTSLVFDHLIDPLTVLRWQSAATWSQENTGVLWGSTLGAYRSFGALRQLSFEGLVNGQTGIDVGVAEYGVRARWEQPVYREWLRTELLLGYFWPQASEFAPRTTAWAFGASLTMLF